MSHSEQWYAEGVGQSKEWLEEFLKNLGARKPRKEKND